MLDLLLSLDLAEDRAVYRQVAEGLAAAIRRGELAAGQRLLPVRQVADQLEVNFNTIARAYRLLAEDGLVESRQGSGTRVASKPDQAQQALALESMTSAFLQRAYQRGFGPQEVRWEFAAAIRRWLQEGSPPLV